MDKKEAIVLLIASVREIPSLKNLDYGNEKYELWFDGVKHIIKSGLSEDDFTTFITTNVPVTVIDFLTPAEVLQDSYVERLGAYEVNLKKIVQKYEIIGFGEEPARKIEPKDKVELPIYLFDKMQLHPKVVEASRELFIDGHYRDAIYRAFVEVNNSVKLKAKSAGQLDGKRLMSTVFSPENPIIRLNPLETQTDKDEQEGFMFLFMGAMQGIRNPKAHENLIQNNPHIALKLIGFASLLIETISFWEA